MNANLVDFSNFLSLNSMHLSRLEKISTFNESLLSFEKSEFGIEVLIEGNIIGTTTETLKENDIFLIFVNSNQESGVLFFEDNYLILNEKLKEKYNINSKKIGTINLFSGNLNSDDFLNRSFNDFFYEELKYAILNICETLI